MEVSTLYLKDTYLNKNIEVLCNRVIIEYDLKSANTNLCREYHLLPIEMIEKIESKDKKARVVEIGLLQRKDKKFKDSLKNAFVDIRRRFFEENHIEDADVLSVKKDAIFCLKEMQHTKFGACEFVKKNTYSSYLYVDHLELYYNRGGFGSKKRVDVKGLSDVVVALHEDFMMDFFRKLFYNMEESTEEGRNRFLSKFITDYKLKKLEVGYYREFNQESLFILNDAEETYEDAYFIPDKDPVNLINIDYNFSHILLPILQILL